MTTKENVINDIENTPVLVYIKGTKESPACRWSAQIVHILDQYEVEYEDRNVLIDPEIRMSVSEYSDWATIPQLFVKGKFVGGGDIVKELHNQGSLGEVIKA